MRLARSTDVSRPSTWAMIRKVPPLRAPGRPFRASREVSSDTERDREPRGTDTSTENTFLNRGINRAGSGARREKRTALWSASSTVAPSALRTDSTTSCRPAGKKPMNSAAPPERPEWPGRSDRPCFARSLPDRPPRPGGGGSAVTRGLFRDLELIRQGYHRRAPGNRAGSSMPASMQTRSPRVPSVTLLSLQ